MNFDFNAFDEFSENVQIVPVFLFPSPKDEGIENSTSYIFCKGNGIPRVLKIS